MTHLPSEAILRAMPSGDRCFGEWDSRRRRLVIYAEGASAEEPGYPPASTRGGRSLKDTWLVVGVPTAASFLLADSVLRPLANALGGDEDAASCTPDENSNPLTYGEGAVSVLPC